jgi:multiple sugar transport system substrate-binding protein
MRSKWLVGGLILLVFAFLYLVPYSSFFHRSPPEETQIYFADRISEAHRILIDKYNALHAGQFKVVPIDFPTTFNTNERKEILARSLRGEGDGIDLMAVDVIWVQRFAKWCEPLGQYFPPSELKGLIPEALYSCYSNGELMAVPLYLVQGVLYYRDDLVRSAKGGDEIVRSLQRGMTWPDFLKLKSIIHPQGPFYVFTGAEYEGMICTYIENLLSLDHDYFRTSGFDFTTPAAQEALQLLVDLIYKYGASPRAVADFTEFPSYEYYVKNNGVFIRGWTSFDKDFQSAPIDPQKEMHLRKAPLPYLPGGQPTSLFGGWNLMVSKFSKKKEAVLDFLKFLLREDSQEVFFAHGAYHPVLTAFYENPANDQKYPELPWLRRLMRTGVHRPTDKDYTNYSKIMSHYFGLAIKNEISVDEAVRRATAAIQSEKSTGVRE